MGPCHGCGDPFDHGTDGVVGWARELLLTVELNGPRAVKTDMAQEGDGVVGCNVMLGGNSATLLLTVGQKAK